MRRNDGCYIHGHRGFDNPLEPVRGPMYAVRRSLGSQKSLYRSIQIARRSPCLRPRIIVTKLLSRRVQNKGSSEESELLLSEGMTAK